MTPNDICSAFRKGPTRARRELFSLSDRPPRPHSRRQSSFSLRCSPRAVTARRRRGEAARPDRHRRERRSVRRADPGGGVRAGAGGRRRRAVAHRRGDRIARRRGPRQPGGRRDPHGRVAQGRGDLGREPADRPVAAAPADRRRARPRAQRGAGGAADRRAAAHDAAVAVGDGAAAAPPRPHDHRKSRPPRRRRRRRTRACRQGSVCSGVRAAAVRRTSCG